MSRITIVSEGPVRITQQTLQAAWKRRAPNHRIVIRDATCRGLALVLNAKGWAWRFEYRPRGVDPSTGRRWPSQAVTIGSPESHSPDMAREAAGALKGRSKAGEDLAAERRAKIEEASRQRALTIDRLIGDYLAALPKRPKLRGTGVLSEATVEQELALVRRAVELMGATDLPIAQVTVDHLQRLLTAEAARPATARKLFGALSRFLDWAQQERCLTVNPCAMLGRARRPKAVAARPHFLAPEEMAKLWRGADGLPIVNRDFVRFLIAVPCRLREATRLDWSHLDLGRAIWTIPGPLSKNREPHRIHLHSIALELLKGQYEGDDVPRRGLVFPSPKAGRPLETFTDMKAALSALTGVTGWTFHDFRRSFASACADHGVAEAVADAVLSHRQSATRGGVLGVYQRSTRWPEQMNAMETWARVLGTAIEGTSELENVVPFDRRLRQSG